MFLFLRTSCFIRKVITSFILKWRPLCSFVCITNYPQISCLKTKNVWLGDSSVPHGMNAGRSVVWRAQDSFTSASRALVGTARWLGSAGTVWSVYTDLASMVGSAELVFFHSCSESQSSSDQGRSPRALMTWSWKSHGLTTPISY